ncbi:MAG: NAD(P)-binding protein, partial [Rhodospirillales bacterium]|nr:NAD(P)-binding protein [Rhodospirillales bacterium]
MMGGRLYVIGAGMAGLAAAVRAVGNGRDVTVMEAARHGGGRCRSFHDAGLDRVIDNGTHMILGANQKVFKFLDAVGAKDGLLPMGNGEFNFFDLASGDSWSLRPGKESIPWWLLLPSRRVPDTGLRDYLALRHLAGAGGGASLGDFFDPSRPIYERLWAPLSLAVLNNRPETASARLFWRVFEKTFFKGAKACQPFWAPAGLSAALIGPAMAFLLENGTEVRFSRLLKALLSAEERITQLNFAKDSIELAPEDSVILAVPPGQARS